MAMCAGYLSTHQVSLPHGTIGTGLALVPGRGNFGGEPLAEDRVDSIEVNTGAARFAIKKRGFDLFDSVKVDGIEVVSPGKSEGIALAGVDGAEILASGDASIEVSIEENGPLRR